MLPESELDPGTTWPGPVLPSESVHHFADTAKCEPERQSVLVVVEPQVSATGAVRNAALVGEPFRPAMASLPFPSRWYTATRPACGALMATLIVERSSSRVRATF